MTSPLSVLSLLFAALWSSMPAVQQQAPRVLDIAVEDDASPWSRPDGTGYANDVVRAAFAAQHIEVRLHVMPYARCKRIVMQGEMAACLSMSRDPELAESVVFPDAPLFICNSDFFESVARPLGANNLKNLRRGTRVGVVNGYEYPDTIRSLAANGTIVLDVAASDGANLRKLAAGRIDAALVNYNEVRTIDYLLGTAALNAPIRKAVSGGILRSYIGFSRRHAQGAFAREQFTLGMRYIATHGLLGAIESAWERRIAAEVRDMRAKSAATKPTPRP